MQLRNCSQETATFGIEAVTSSASSSCSSTIVRSAVPIDGPSSSSESSLVELRTVSNEVGSNEVGSTDVAAGYAGSSELRPDGGGGGSEEGSRSGAARPGEGVRVKEVELGLLDKGTEILVDLELQSPESVGVVSAMLHATHETAGGDWQNSPPYLTAQHSRVRTINGESPRFERSMMNPFDDGFSSLTKRRPDSSPHPMTQVRKQTLNLFGNCSQTPEVRIDDSNARSVAGSIVAAGDNNAPPAGSLMVANSSGPTHATHTTTHSSNTGGRGGGHGDRLKPPSSTGGLFLPHPVKLVNMARLALSLPLLFWVFYGCLASHDWRHSQYVDPASGDSFKTLLSLQAVERVVATHGLPATSSIVHELPTKFSTAIKTHCKANDEQAKKKSLALQGLLNDLFTQPAQLRDIQQSHVLPQQLAQQPAQQPAHPPAHPPAPRPAQQPAHLPAQQPAHLPAQQAALITMIQKQPHTHTLDQHHEPPHRGYPNPKDDPNLEDDPKLKGREPADGAAKPEEEALFLKAQERIPEMRDNGSQSGEEAFALLSLSDHLHLPLGGTVLTEDKTQRLETNEIHVSDEFTGGMPWFQGGSHQTSVERLQQAADRLAVEPPFLVELVAAERGIEPPPDLLSPLNFATETLGETWGETLGGPVTGGGGEPPVIFRSMSVNSSEAAAVNSLEFEGHSNGEGPLQGGVRSLLEVSFLRPQKLAVFNAMFGPSFRDVDCRALANFRSAGIWVRVFLWFVLVCLAWELVIAVSHAISYSLSHNAAAAFDFASRARGPRAPPPPPPFVVPSQPSPRNHWVAVDMEAGRHHHRSTRRLWRRLMQSSSRRPMTVLGESHLERWSEAFWWRPLRYAMSVLRLSEPEPGDLSRYVTLSLLEGPSTTLSALALVCASLALLIWMAKTARPACLNEHVELRTCTHGRGLHLLWLAHALLAAHLATHLCSGRICTYIKRLKERNSGLLVNYDSCHLECR